MSDHIKRLEDNWSVTEHGIATPEEVETAIVRLGADDARLAYRLQGYVGSLLSDVERLRELVGGLIVFDEQTPGGLKDSTDNDGKPYQSAFLDALLDTIARQALSAPHPRRNP